MIKISGFVVLLVFGSVLPANAATVDSYLCVLDAATGFAFNKITTLWEVTEFRADKKFILSRSKNKKFSWDVKEVGESIPEAFCEKDFTESGILECVGFADFKFNKPRLRFLYIYPIGYWNDDDKFGMFKEGANSPAIGIGKCSPL